MNYWTREAAGLLIVTMRHYPITLNAVCRSYMKEKGTLVNKKLLLKIIENWPIKALSLAIALILFVFYRLNTMTTRPLSTPLIIETNSSLIPASAYPKTVRITLRGDDDGIKAIADGDIEAYVDLAMYETGGLYSAPVQIRKKGSALSVEPLEISVSPLKVSLQLDQRISKSVPLMALIQGRVADGFDLVSHAIFPLEIVLIGPLGLLEPVSEIKTDTIDLSGRSANFITEVKVANPNPLFIVTGSEMASVSCIIRPSVLVRSVDGIPINFIKLSPSFKADTGGRTGSIRIEGGQEQLDAFQPSSVFFSVDCSGILEPGTYTLPVIFNLPPGFLLLRREPEELNVTITLNDPDNEDDTI
jgi:YbbR domain-containing protein